MCGDNLVKWKVRYAKQAEKDAKRIQQAGLQAKVQSLLNVIETDPFQIPPTYEKLIGDLEGAYARRINIQHRLVYQVLKEEHAVKVMRMWTHYE
ncbi:addiction module protein [Planctomycetales bacterium]|nr:addiction module protein [Planctomycetales bacterium]